MPRKKPPPIADREEVLQTFTSIMRGEMTEASLRRNGGEEERVLTPPKISERCKASTLDDGLGAKPRIGSAAVR